ncbi:hypothetical protein ANN_04198 [Periplaneta americana]|uniref:Uncharacterized protein n=1 Tax=Periplaneta americana TaxID=6978 RepID=A0ABQ8T9G3_PERAM|nr:hypothetical protein ANN_04198 [Periplaneta americana]
MFAEGRSNVEDEHQQLHGQLDRCRLEFPSSSVVERCSEWRDAPVMLLLYELFQAELKTITTVGDATVGLKLWLISWVHAHLAKLFVTASITRSDL